MSASLEAFVDDPVPDNGISARAHFLAATIFVTMLCIQIARVLLWRRKALHRSSPASLPYNMGASRHLIVRQKHPKQIRSNILKF
jgi:hypothetical protein